MTLPWAVIVTAAVESVVGRFGRLDGLVLNAGLIIPGGVADLAPTDWDTMLSVNLTGESPDESLADIAHLRSCCYRT